MNEVHIRVDERGRHQPYRNAIDVGPAFVSPRDAVTYANELEAAPVVSPLRVPAEPSTVRVVPPTRVPRSDGSAGVRRRASGASPRP